MQANDYFEVDIQKAKQRTKASRKNIISKNSLQAAQTL